jgi:dTMP kinase
MSLLTSLGIQTEVSNEAVVKDLKIPSGKFIVIDGTDGSGKTTQFKLLKETLEQSGYRVETADFPQYGQKSAGAVEEYLNGKYGQVNAYAGSIFYAVDRFDASFKIRKWLGSGCVVISNRYVTASAGHQGGKIEDEAQRIQFFKWLDNLEYNIFGIPKPDLNIILHVPAEIAQTLVDKKDSSMRAYNNGKKRDIHEDDLNHLINAEKTYLQIAGLFPNTKLVECMDGERMMSIQEVHNKVWELVRRIALKGVVPGV